MLDSQLTVRQCVDLAELTCSQRYMGLNSSVSQNSGMMDQTEQLTLCFDRGSGLRAVIAIDDTTMGPGLGGVRWLSYPDEQTAQDEARRLARMMTLKNACADLPYGGAKSVILRDARANRDTAYRKAQLHAFGRFVDRLGGAYLPGVDMGTSVEDLAEIGLVAHEVSCNHQDPSPWTALGVFAGICSALSCGGFEVAGAHVVVQGTGHVGAELARLLAGADCHVSVADVDPIRARTVGQRRHAQVSHRGWGRQRRAGYPRCREHAGPTEHPLRPRLRDQRRRRDPHPRPT